MRCRRSTMRSSGSSSRPSRPSGRASGPFPPSRTAPQSRTSCAHSLLHSVLTRARMGGQWTVNSEQWTVNVFSCACATRGCCAARRAAAEAEPAGRAGGVRLARLCQLPEVVRFVRAVDYRFYQALVRLLIPDLLRPIPSAPLRIGTRTKYGYIVARLLHILYSDSYSNGAGGLTQSIRNFAKSLEGWMKSALSQSSPAPEKENDLALPGTLTRSAPNAIRTVQSVHEIWDVLGCSCAAPDAETSGRAANVGVPAATRGAKLQVLTVFAQLLRRYTSLNHLAQAARAVLANSQQINQVRARSQVQAHTCKLIPAELVTSASFMACVLRARRCSPTSHASTFTTSK